MPNISGLVLFSPTRTINSISTLVPISSVPITLYNSTTNVGACVLSNNLGNFEFASVPLGSYKLVETFGATPSGPSPFDFANAVTLANVIPEDPDVLAITITLPQGTNYIDSLTPNTLNITINTLPIINQHFVDAPIIYEGITILNQISTGPNLITLAGNGTFGSNLPSTPVNTSPSSNPYPGLSLGFGYQQYSSTTPSDGNVSIVNIQTLSNFGTWWNLTDHTKGDETGNFLVVNGANPGESIFNEIVSVEPSTYYAFSAWVANQAKVDSLVPPKFLIIVTAFSDGVPVTIYFQSSRVIGTNTIVPNWIQFGAIFNSEKFSSVAINILSIGPEANGNDYALDDISLNKVIIDSNIIQTSKSVSNLNNPTINSAIAGDTLIYSISITNSSPTTNVVNMLITDTVPIGTSFILGSVTGGTIVSSTIPNPLVISTDTILPGQSKNITFKAIVDSGITVPNISNIATLNYGIEIDPNLGPAPGSISTNIVNTAVVSAVLNSNKTVSPTTITNNGIATYTIDLNNVGTLNANNILFTDSIPLGLNFVPGSFYINAQNIPTATVVNNTLSITIPDIAAKGNARINFNAIVSTISSATIINTATINYNYNNGTTISDTKVTSSNAVLLVSSIPVGNISLIKGSSCNYMRPNCINTYTITIANNSSETITNVIFSDSLPSQMCYIHNSFMVNDWNYRLVYLPPTIPIGIISANSISVVSFKTKLKYVSCETVLNNMACISYNTPSISSSTICSNVSSITLVRCCN